MSDDLTAVINLCEHADTDAAARGLELLLPSLRKYAARNGVYAPHYSHDIARNTRLPEEFQPVREYIGIRAVYGSLVNERGNLGSLSFLLHESVEKNDVPELVREFGIVRGFHEVANTSPNSTGIEYVLDVVNNVLFLRQLRKKIMGGSGSSDLVRRVADVATDRSAIWDIIMGHREKVAEKIAAIDLAELKPKTEDLVRRLEGFERSRVAARPRAERFRAAC